MEQRRTWAVARDDGGVVGIADHRDANGALVLRIGSGDLIRVERVVVANGVNFLGAGLLGVGFVDRIVCHAGATATRERLTFIRMPESRLVKPYLEQVKSRPR